MYESPAQVGFSTYWIGLPQVAATARSSFGADAIGVPVSRDHRRVSAIRSGVRAPDGPDCCIRSSRVALRGVLPVGFLITVGLVALGMAAALWPPFRTKGWCGHVGRQRDPERVAVPGLLLAARRDVARGLAGRSSRAAAWVALGLAAVTFVGTPVLVRRSLRAAPAIEQALDGGFGPRWRQAGAVESIARNLPWGRILFAPVPLFHRGVTRISNLGYGDAGRRNRPRSLSASGGWQRRAGADPSARWRLLVRARAQELLRAAAALPARPPGLGLHQPPTGCNPLPPSRRADRRQEVIAWLATACEHCATPTVSCSGKLYGARLATLRLHDDAPPSSWASSRPTRPWRVVGLYGYYGAIDSHRQPLPPRRRLCRARLCAASDRPRRPRHLHLRKARTLARRTSPQRLRQPRRLRRAARCRALVRPAHLDPLRGCHRQHRGLRSVDRRTGRRYASLPTQ